MKNKKHSNLYYILLEESKKHQPSQGVKRQIERNIEQIIKKQKIP